MRTIIAALLALPLAACGSQSANMMVGTGQSYTSLADQREALRTVQVTDGVPEGATVLGPVDASRCHRRFTDEAPTEELVRNDLRVTAFARGADGVAGVIVEKRSALVDNCWWSLVARGTMYRKPS